MGGHLFCMKCAFSMKKVLYIKWLGDMPTGAAAKRSKITKFEKSVDTCFCTCYYIKVVSSE